MRLFHSQATKAWVVLVLLCLAVEAPVTSAQSGVKLDDRTKKQLTIFCQDVVSAVAEDAFHKGRISNANVIISAITLNALRHPQRLKDCENWCVKIAAHDVESTAARYFGRKIKHQSARAWIYKKGFYVGSGDEFEFLEPEKLRKISFKAIGRGLLVASVDYESPYDEGKPILTAKITLKVVKAKGRSRFILRDYTMLHGA